MTDQTQGGDEGIQLSPEEQASVEVGQRGFSTPTNDFTPKAPETPHGVPAEFVKDGQVDVAALAAKYAELAKGAEEAPKEEAPAVAEEAPAAEVKPDGKIEKAKVEEAAAEEATNPLADLLEAAKADYSTAQAFTEETATKLAEAGIPLEIQQVYLAGLEALSKSNLEAIHSFTGGEAEYSSMAAWAASTLTDAELDAYNDAIDNPALRENAVRGLYARYQSARPSEGNLITPAGTPSAAGDVYSDRSQLISDQRDPRYATDPAFRQSVMDKLARSHSSGFKLNERPMFERTIITS